MTCPSDARLAAAVSGEDAAAIEHARTCLRCRASLIEQREIIAEARRSVLVPLAPARRATLAAEVMAHSDFAAPTWRDRRVVLAGLVLAAAAAVIVLANSPRSGRAPALDVATSDEPSVKLSRRVTFEAVPPAQVLPRRAEIVASDADFARERHGDQDLVTLHDGALAIDAREREPVVIVAGDTKVRIASSHARIVARDGVIVTTQVFAGSAEVTTAGKRIVIEAGNVWTRDEPAPRADTPAGSLAAFRAGWEALRATRYADAIEAFDRATDPVVAEDAAFWAAIASERAGDRAEAATRLRAFIERFPDSPRLQSARAALDRVTR